MPQFDRAGEDVGNIVALEHVNVRVPDQARATDFYITALGLTRDPYLVTGTDNMWVNVGQSQFHLPTGKPQLLRGRIGLVMPDLDDLATRLAAAGMPCEREGGHIDTACPWGNRIRVHGPGDERTLAMAYLAFDVPEGTAEAVAAFYREVWKTGAWVDLDGVARVPVGHGQELLFVESPRPLPDYDGHHIAIYVADFSGPHRWLEERELVSEESNRWQYRFLDIVDPGTGEPVFRIEHEVRSMTHPIYGRSLVNRNPHVTSNAFAAGHEAVAWRAPPEPC
ncbi:MAG: hypothetical protein OXU19_11495 [bacterium]|nr:hypothetical protein [bacterium]MDE0242960.1 hypothetical protein [bacterium]MDE0416697.1 hypothetical protein [bacterium]